MTKTERKIEQLKLKQTQEATTKLFWCLEDQISKRTTARNNLTDEQPEAIKKIDEENEVFMQASSALERLTELLEDLAGDGHKE